MQHPFVFNPGQWLGEGIIEFSFSPEKLRYYIDWGFIEEEDDVICSIQRIEVEGGAEHVINTLRFYNKTSDTFLLSLENSVVEKAEGNGVIDDKTVAWEFRDNPMGIEGYDIYKLQDDGTYAMKAEYLSPDKMRTMITGSIWKKTSS